MLWGLYRFNNMKAKYLILIIFSFFIVTNTLAGGIFSGYEMSTCLLIDFSIVISLGLIYHLFSSSIADGYKIGTFCILLLSGVIRTVCMGVMGTEVQDNIFLLVSAIIFILELILLFVVSYLSKK